MADGSALGRGCVFRGPRGVEKECLEKKVARGTFVSGEVWGLVEGSGVVISEDAEIAWACVGVRSFSE